MHIEDRIFGLAVTPLAEVSIPKKNIFACIPEVELRAFLVLLPFYLRILHLLDIKLCYLDSRATNRQDLVNQPDCFEMAIHLVVHGRCKPSLRLLSVLEARLAGSRFGTSSR